MNSLIQNHYSFSELIDTITSLKPKIYLYGAGNGASSYSKIALAALKYFNIKPEAFIDDDNGRAGQSLYNIPIIKLASLDSKDANSIIFISSNYFDSINSNLINHGKNNNIYSLTELIKATPLKAFDGIMEYAEVQRRAHTHSTKLNRIQNINQKDNKLILNALDIQVTEKCTMKCIDCSNLMQYYEKPINSNEKNLNESISNVLASIDHLDDARIIGGEPFLYSELESLLAILCRSEKVLRITIYSNATFVPKDAILNALANKKIQVEITDYDSLSKNHDAMIASLKKFNISYISHKPQNWTDSAKIGKNNKTPAELANMFEKCCVNDVLTLLHGKIYHCPFSANSHNLKAIPEKEYDYIDVNNNPTISNLRESIQKFYFGRKFLTACGYCKGRDYSQPQVVPAIQTKLPLKYIPILKN